MVVDRTDELKGEKEKLDAIVSAIEGGLCVVDSSDRKVIWANKTLLEWLGEPSISGMMPEQIYGGSDMHRAIVDDKMLREVIYNDYGRKKGYFQITSTPLVGPHAHRQTLVLIQDITDIKKMEDRMMQSEKLSALARIPVSLMKSATRLPPYLLTCRY
jgi:transcriptional regulator with PAS, ATPase and Fis domain